MVVFLNDVEFFFEGCFLVLIWLVKLDVLFWRFEEFEVFFVKVCNKLDVWKVKDFLEWLYLDLWVIILLIWFDVGFLVLFVVEIIIGFVNWWYEGVLEIFVEVDNELMIGFVGVVYEIVGKVGGIVLVEDVIKLLLFVIFKCVWYRDVLLVVESG